MVERYKMEVEREKSKSLPTKPFFLFIGDENIDIITDLYLDVFG